MSDENLPVDASQEPLEVKLIAAASDSFVNVTPEKCERIRKLLASAAPPASAAPAPVVRDWTNHSWPQEGESLMDYAKRIHDEDAAEHRADTQPTSIECTCTNNPLNSCPNLPHDKNCPLFIVAPKAQQPANPAPVETGAKFCPTCSKPMGPYATVRASATTLLRTIEDGPTNPARELARQWLIGGKKGSTWVEAEVESLADVLERYASSREQAALERAAQHRPVIFTLGEYGGKQTVFRCTTCDWKGQVEIWDDHIRSLKENK